MIRFITDPPKGFFTLASCDPVYFAQHAGALMASCAEHNNPVHVHVINPDNEDFKLMQLYRDQANKIDPGTTITMSYEKIDHNSIIGKERVYYACSRFLVANELLIREDVSSIFVTDIDAFFMTTMGEPDANIGLFLRDSIPGTQGWEALGTRVAAGAVYYTQNYAWFAERVANRIRGGLDHSPEWFLDQVCLNQTYIESAGNIHKFHTFDNKFMDWEFVEGTTLWTGKGPRKHENPTYLKKKAYYEELLNDA